ncbi:MAG TPA: hypothetical protein ENK23_03840, partial [Sorangium sp.]|nr:hypothetical protein [Sorangium sp.]
MSDEQGLPETAIDAREQLRSSQDETPTSEVGAEAPAAAGPVSGARTGQKEMPAGERTGWQPHPIMGKWQAYGLATLSGVLCPISFAGFDVWPLAFVAWVPLLVAMRG